LILGSCELQWAKEQAAQLYTKNHIVWLHRTMFSLTFIYCSRPAVHTRRFRKGGDRQIS